MLSSLSPLSVVSEPPGAAAYDLVVVGGNAAGVSMAVSAQREGLRRVRILESSGEVAYSELVGEHQLDVGFREQVQSIDLVGPEVVVTTGNSAYPTRACVVAGRGDAAGWAPADLSVASARILVDQLPDATKDQDVLVVGTTDDAVELTSSLVAAGARVVLAAGGMNPTKLAPATERTIRRLERERRATVLYRAAPDDVKEVNGYPMAFFSDRAIPDLQFDYVVIASGRRPLRPEDVGLSEAALSSGKVWFLVELGDTDVPVPLAPVWRIDQLMARAFPELSGLAPRSSADRRRGLIGAVAELRQEQYNATITSFEPIHSDLWVLRVRPDHGDVAHLPGQYASLALGYWEERIDDCDDHHLVERWDKLVRRSYSISSPMFDDHGYLTGEVGTTELEFYIVLVPPSDSNVPGLTPRLALKQPGDRIHLGPKIAGRYTLGPVVDPRATVLFFSTGTGEAPHNAMVVDLLRKGHHGPIVSAVSVRRWADLGYLDKHRELECRYRNYHYLPMPTREADVPKRYIQDLITEDRLADVDVRLDAETTHVFLCGNPAMIGLPEETDGELRYPEVTGIAGLLAQRGFTLDRRHQPGNVHFEEYW
jgi:ferredoxin/flavodoxin---NADP+ reductase